MTTPDPLAIDEWKLLQTIISSQRDVRLRVRGWGITLIAALAVAALSSELSLTRFEYLSISTFAVVMFWLLEATYHQAERRAMDRSEAVEQSLRNESKYTGPYIGRSMRQPRVKPTQFASDVFASLGYMRLALTYVALIGLNLGVAVGL